MRLIEAAVSLWMALLSQEPSTEGKLGEQTVHTEKAFVYPKPSFFGGKPIKEFPYGHIVTVTAVVKSFSQIALPDGTPGFIPTSSLIARAQFKPVAANEEQAMKLRGQGHEGARGVRDSDKPAFDQSVEDERRKENGGKLDGPYKQVDEMERTPEFKAKRDTLLEMLEKFRKSGKLGEFNVK